MELQDLLKKAWELKEVGDKHKALELYSEAFDLLVSEASNFARNQQDTHIDKEGEDNIRQILPKHFDEPRNYLRRDKTAATISNNMGVIFAELSDTTSARKFFEQAVELTTEGTEYPDPKIGLQELDK